MGTQIKIIAMREELGFEAVNFDNGEIVNFGVAFSKGDNGMVSISLESSVIIVTVDRFGRRISFVLNDGSAAVELSMTSAGDPLDQDVLYSACFNYSEWPLSADDAELFALLIADRFWDTWTAVANNLDDHDIELSTFIAVTTGVALPG